MRTLFITNTYLDGNSGGVYATKAYINAFAQLSETMTLVYAMKDTSPTDSLCGHINMIPVEDRRTVARKFLDLCFGVVNRFQRNLLGLVDLSQFDIVVFNNSDVSSGLIKIVKKYGLKVITIHHNYQIEYLKGNSSRITLLPNLFWTYIYERDAVRNSDLNLTLTKQDITLLKKHYGIAKFEVLGVFEFKPFEIKGYLETTRGHNYVITGWLGAKQTEDSLLPWIKDYYPILKTVDPEAKLTIAGRDPSEKLLLLAQSNGIDVIASPVDIQPILDTANYYICPIDRGGGLKLRNMDGLKSGLPVLTHFVSARGYEYMLDKECLFVYSDQQSFISAVTSMTRLQTSKRDIINIYSSFYSLQIGVERLRFILERWAFI